METFKFTKSGDHAVSLGKFLLYWTDQEQSYTVTHPSHLGIICQVHPYKGETGTLHDPKKMFTVKANSYPGVGYLEQMVKGADLLDYLESIRMGRSQ